MKIETQDYFIDMQEPAIAKWLASPTGQVAQDLSRRGERVKNQAVLNASGATVPGAQNPEGRGPRVKTGRLRSSIRKTVGMNPNGVYVDIIANVLYARELELGKNGRDYRFLRPALIRAFD